MSLILLVQSIFLRRFLTIDHKFSIGFKSGEFPSQSDTIVFIFFEPICYHFSLVAGCRVLLKNCMWVEVRQFYADSSFDDLQISFVVYHALDRYKRSRSVNRKATTEYLFVSVLHRLHKMFFTQLLVRLVENKFCIESLNNKMTF